MGYFSSDPEGEEYQDVWCRRCLRDNFEKDVCPIFTLQTKYNYDEAYHELLHTLIPRVLRTA